MEDLKEKLGTRIQEIRKSKKITQEKLAEMVGLDIPNISNIERGKRFVSASTLEKIIIALDVSPQELFDFEHVKSRKDLLKEINSFLNSATDKEIEYLCRIIKLYKESVK